MGRTRAQIDLPLEKRSGWGGARKGAGRKRTGPRRRVDHRSREAFGENTPVHVTWRVLPHVCNLRTQRAFAALIVSMTAVASRHDFRVVRFSVQTNHLHLVVEADGAEALARAMHGFGIRFARALNRIMRTRGPVFADRYHAHVLTTPREVWNALHYVAHNHAIHVQRSGGSRGAEADPFSVGPESLDDPTALWRRLVPRAQPISPAIGWLLRVGWERGNPLAA